MMRLSITSHTQQRGPSLESAAIHMSLGQAAGVVFMTAGAAWGEMPALMYNKFPAAKIKMIAVWGEMRQPDEYTVFIGCRVKVVSAFLCYYCENVGMSLPYLIRKRIYEARPKTDTAASSCGTGNKPNQKLV
ncbi:uncharacterized protein [Lolium perenne]|uniref:uncharacterized protein isoform X2 n=1 Tax=Lolium perenne TaxID=4522 RepID=UPI003A996958